MREEEKSWVVIDGPKDGVVVATLIPPSPMPEYPVLWGINASDPFWEDYAANALAHALLPLADHEASSMVVDLSATTRHRASVYHVLDTLWLRLGERGKSLVLVYSTDCPIRRSHASVSTDEGFKFDLKVHGLRALCPITRTVAEGISLASDPLCWQPVTDEESSQLAAVQQRFHALIHERIGHLWGSGKPPELPDAVRLYRAGVKSGGFGFPYGGLDWEFGVTGGEIVLKYEDSVRICSGWGCRYEISAQETRLVESGLD